MAALALLGATESHAVGWAGNYNQALQESKQLNKDLLIYLSGSQWDAGTKAFDKLVAEEAGLSQMLEKDYVLMNLDFPRNARLDPASKGKVALADRYGVRQLPLIILADNQGRPYRRFSPANDSLDAFFKQVASATDAKSKRDNGLAAARQKKGVEKAKALIEVLEGLDRASLRHHYAAELAEIKEADTGGATDFVAKLEEEAALQAEQGKYRELLAKGDFQAILTEVAKDQEGASKEKAQRLALYRVQALARLNKFAEAKTAIDEMAAILPESDYAKQAERFKDTVDRFEERQKRMKEAIAKAPQQPARPTGPIVSKPIAIVSDPKVLYRDLEKFAKQREAAEKANTEAATAFKKNQELIEDLQTKLANARKQVESLAAAEAKAKEELKLASERHTTMTQVIESHEEMEAAKKKKAAEAATPAGKPAAPTKEPAAPAAKPEEVQKAAEELKKKAKELAKP